MQKLLVQQKRIVALILLIVPLVWASIPSGVVSAANKAKNTTSQTANAASATNATGITQSYNADPSVEIGMLVELKSKAANTVVPLPSNNIQDMLGVVIPANNATIVLTPQTVSQQQVLVATSGHYGVLVSNQNGPIKVGDYITISAISGVGMKANEIENEVLGKAAGNFSGSSNVIGTVSLKNTVGHTTTVSIGRIPVDINISHNPLFQKTAEYVPSFLAKAATAVADHPLTASRIYLCLILLFITALVTGIMLYSGVRNGMVAVGRNPLSKKSIIRSLVETVMAGLIIFVAGVFAVYLLLKL